MFPGGGELRVVDIERYFGMSLAAVRLGSDLSEERGAKAISETRNLTSCPWWSLALSPSEMGPGVNGSVLSDYLSSLTMI